MFNIFKSRMSAIQLKRSQDISQSCCCEIKHPAGISDYVVKFPWMAAFLVSALNLKALFFFFLHGFQPVRKILQLQCVLVGDLCV